MNRSKGFKAVAWILALSFIHPGWVVADDLGMTFSGGKDLSAPKMNFGSNEYVSGDYPGAVLMKVNLWGAVGKPGIHVIPTHTDLITLLSYAGGPLESAKLNHIYIKRWQAGKESVIRVDGEDILQGTETKAPVLQANDIVVIPKRQPLLSQDTVSVVAFLTSLLSIVAVSFAVFKK